MNATRNQQKGFTLVEALVALAIVSILLVPATLWFFKTRTNQAAWEKFEALQVLEDRMHRAALLPGRRKLSEVILEPRSFRLEIKSEETGKEIRVLGTIWDRRGRSLVTLEHLRFRARKE